MTIKKLFTSLLLLIWSISMFAQLKSPSDFFNREVGAHFTPHHELVAYFKHVEANSDYVQLKEYGRTNENRPLMVAFISTPDNLNNLEAICTNNLRHAGIDQGAVDPNLDRAIVWLSCTVHGNEAAGAESAPFTLFELVDPQNQTTKTWLENTIVILDPALNPDGFARYTSWYKRTAGDLINVDPYAREHNEPWPGGRTNHYYYDLNRDWAWQTQIESQQRMVLYNEWLPHIHADLHEQGVNSPYYFAPAAQPYHAYITQWQRDFQETVGKNHAKYFDANGWLYFTKEVFDLLYPSYGDTYPMYNGSIGMTYEQGGSGRAGRAILMDNLDTLTLRDRIEHHKTTSLSTVEVGSKNMRSVVDNFARFFENSQNTPPGKYKSFIIKQSTNNQKKLEAFCKLLDRNGITYGRVSEGPEISGAYSYLTGRNKTLQVSNEDLIVSTAQPKGMYAQILLEPKTTIVDSLTYDITAWSLIYAYGLDGYASTVSLIPDQAYQFEQPVNSAESEAYAYLIRWESLKDAEVLAALIQQGIRVRYAKGNFFIDGQSYNRGTLVITKADNRKNIQFAKQLLRIANQHQTKVIPVETGYMQGGSDFGSSSYAFIESPKVGLIMGNRTRSNSIGQVWHFFDRTLKYPLHLFETNDLEDIPLSNINTLILTDGIYREIAKQSEELKSWIREGGHLILIGAANLSFDTGAFGLKKYATETAEKSAKREVAQFKLDHRLDEYAGSSRRQISAEIPGAILKHKLDNSHPLAYGFDNYYFSLKTTSLNYQNLEDVWNVGYLEDEFMSSGFIGYQIKERLKETTTFAVEDMGRGNITYLIDNPLYRSFWYTGKMLFSNAIFFVGN